MRIENFLAEAVVAAISLEDVQGVRFVNPGLDDGDAVKDIDRVLALALKRLRIASAEARQLVNLDRAVRKKKASGDRQC